MADTGRFQLKTSQVQLYPTLSLSGFQRYAVSPTTLQPVLPMPQCTPLGWHAPASQRPNRVVESLACSDGSVSCLLSHCCEDMIKTDYRGRVDYSFRGLEPMATVVGCTAEQRVGRPGLEQPLRAYILVHTLKAERGKTSLEWMVWAFEVSKPQMTQLLQQFYPSQRIPPTGDEAFEYMSLMGSFSFKLTQAAFRHILIPLRGGDKGFCSQINYFVHRAPEKQKSNWKVRAEWSFFTWTQMPR